MVLSVLASSDPQWNVDNTYTILRIPSKISIVWLVATLLEIQWVSNATLMNDGMCESKYLSVNTYVI